ncbi:MAG TPA: cytochrome c [Edaphobacter sp.]|nr:cytochrome c [Edaphobacter sp.]
MKQIARRAAFATAALSLLVTVGCRQDMHDQPKFFPQRGTEFYADGRSVRPQVENTVARNQLHVDSYFYTGLINGKEGDGMPFPVTMEVLQRGQERYNVYCTPCHSRVGNGEGMIVQRGYAHAGDFHTSRLETAPLGHFFHVISNGYGAMPDYSAQVEPADRWAIVAYIKALQLSQKATEADVAPGSQIESLSDIAQKQGLPESFTQPWVLPPTATYGTPNDQSFVLPSPGSGAPAPASPTASRVTNPNSPAGTGQTVPKQ